MNTPVRDLVGYGKQRPTGRWPNGSKLAVNVVVNYDPFGRPSDETRTVEGQSMVASIELRDAAGRPSIISYPALAGGGTLRVRNVYDPSGVLT